ncbi:MAG: thymidine phosphorylase, partial [Lachnospiraceae bacterium]|nr:thymidine phosphorylase [Lachnospiraceae bacterium]
MRMYDLIMKKRNGEALTKQEIDYMITEYVAGEIPDYQMSAFLMAVYFNGMTEEETVTMTQAVAHSGDMVDLSAIEGIKVDKHSTGGVGDKTTLIITPMVAACGVKVAKMSGRGLGHTGGTVDKLESIPGFQTAIDQERFFEIVNETGLSVIGQSGNMTPADKKLYALRDVTATVDSIPLIAVSIMSKKLAAGSDAILLDVKTGSGAFMKTVDDSIALAREMVSIGENAGRKTAALITDMDIPLGNNIGNSLEVIEAVETLQGNGPEDLTEVCLQLAGNMLYLAGKGTIEECIAMAKKTIEDGSALERLVAMVEAQGGDSSVILDTGKFEKAPY